MKEKQHRSSRTLLISVLIGIALAVIAAVIVIMLARSGGCGGSETETETRAETPAETKDPVITFGDDLSLGDGLHIVSVTRYAGLYVEDGTNDVVSGVTAVRVRNDGVRSVQLLSFKLTDGHGQDYEFRVTTLLPGQEVVALEQNRRMLNIDTDFVSVSVQGSVFFPDALTLCPDQLRIDCTDGFITVENISSETLPAGYVYYKNVSGDILIGGITYRASFRSLAPGESVTLAAAHYTNEQSRLMFVTYAEQS